jgi:sugar O-acyltransferase (sialic acid O-acetyltransferase NeuD family)
MLIIGAKGFAREVLEVMHQNNKSDGIAFYDDVSAGLPDKIYELFPVIRTMGEAQHYFKNNGPQFTLGIGNPLLRKKLFEKFVGIGGKIESTISPYARIGHYGNEIGEGSNIMTGAVLTNGIRVKRGVLINLNCTIGHETVIEEFVELSPGTNISGNCYVGANSFIGTNATILPNIRVGRNVVIAAGSVVTKDVPDQTMVAGVPAVFKKDI